MQLDTDLKMLLTKQEAQEALTAMQMSAAEFERQAGSLSARYSSVCKELTDSTQKAVTLISENGERAISTVLQEAKKKIHLCAWISITAVILCAALCSLVVLWSR
ncbi:unknown [Firmicutes bacterium CAG:170]|nr:unknown [Firmicutes bacterium CAG:170]